MRLGTCLAAQFKWDESQTIFEKVLSHYDSQKGRNSADSLAALMQISVEFYKYILFSLNQHSTICMLFMIFRRGSPLLAMSVLEDCHARHVSVRGLVDPSSLRCACMLGHFCAVMFDDARALAILNDVVLKACATHGHSSIIAMNCKYYLGIAFFMQKNYSAALDCFAPLTNTTIIHGMIVSLVFRRINLTRLFQQLMIS
jgi:hypothetical protein